MEAARAMARVGAARARVEVARARVEAAKGAGTVSFPVLAPVTLTQTSCN